MAKCDISSISLRDEFNEEQCLDALTRIRSVPGVTIAGFHAVGCYAQNPHKITVFTEQHSGALDEIKKLSEVKSIEALTP